MEKVVVKKKEQNVSMVSDEAEKKVEQERNRLVTFSNQRYSLVHQLANIV